MLVVSIFEFNIFALFIMYIEIRIFDWCSVHGDFPVSRHLIIFQ